MNKREIIDGLRQDAESPKGPWHGDVRVFADAQKFVEYRRGETLTSLSEPDIRTLYLLVAHALEDEC